MFDLKGKFYESIKEKYKEYFILEADYQYNDEFEADQIFDQSVQPGEPFNTGDKIIVKKQETADDGDIVVAMFDDGIEEGATVKRFFRREGKIILHPENETMSDFVLDKVTILGRVIGLIRSM